MPEKTDGMVKKLLKPLRKMSWKAKLVGLLAMVVCVILVAGVVWPMFFDRHETEYLTESDLKEAVNIESLSTINYVYHGIAEKHSQLFWGDKLDYRVKYEAHIRASYNMSAIEFNINEDEKTATAYLPEVTIEKPVLNETEFGYLPESATANIKDVIAICREDAANDVNNDEIAREAQESLEQTIRALTLPLLNNEYQLDFKPLTDFNKEGDSNEAE